MNLRRSAGATAVAFALVGGLAGCGSQHLAGGSTTAPTATSTSVVPPTAKRSATELVTAMRASAAKAASFQASGTIEFDFGDFVADSSTDESGSQTSVGSVPVPQDSDLTSLPESTSAPSSQKVEVITVSVAGAMDGSSVELTTSRADFGKQTTRYVGDTSYLRADKGFFDSQATEQYDVSSSQSTSVPAPMSKYADKWISYRDPAGSTAPEKHTMKQLLDETISAKHLSDSTVAAGTVTAIVDEGVPAYRVKIGANELIIAADDASTLRYIALSEDHETQRLRFSHWNDVAAFTAPAGAIPSSQIPGWDPVEADGFGGSDSDSGSGSSDGYDPSASASGYTGDGSLTGDGSATAGWATSTAG
ncbi:hypothetical protein [Branchiibius hedensis]|nr:hypothetical protein [Branchiibius hedensis]